MSFYWYIGKQRFDFIKHIFFVGFSGGSAFRIDASLAYYILHIGFHEQGASSTQQ